MCKFWKAIVAGYKAFGDYLDQPTAPEVKIQFKTYCGNCAFFTGSECDNGPEEGKQKFVDSTGCKIHLKAC